jgi:hypothetical protein
MQLYERDFYAWTQEQAALLRSGQLERLDRVHLAEEIEALGRQERRELVNRLGILLGHLLKWQFQPHLRVKAGEQPLASNAAKFSDSSKRVLASNRSWRQLWQRLTKTGSCS